MILFRLSDAVRRLVPLSPLLLTLSACAPTAERIPDATPSPAPAPPATEGYLSVPGGRVWYRRMGTGPGLPLLAVHGGPGGTSCRFAALAPLADERPVIYYDQLGSGRSDHPADTTLWTVARFVEELEAVRRGLGLDSLVLLGHSWGGALVAEYLLTAPRPAVRAVIFSSPLLSTPRWIADANLLRAAMPAPLREALDRHERAGTTDHPEYLAATDSFYARHVSRIPTPPEPGCAGVAGNDTIYRQMWGPTEFRSTGSLRTWDRAADLDDISIPALLVAGEFDEARPATLAELAATMPRARVVTIPGAAHGTYREKPAEYQAAVREFLRTVEPSPAPR
jgi:proline-specific peptidase